MTQSSASASRCLYKSIPDKLQNSVGSFHLLPSFFHWLPPVAHFLLLGRCSHSLVVDLRNLLFLSFVCSPPVCILVGTRSILGGNSLYPTFPVLSHYTPVLISGCLARIHTFRIVCPCCLHALVSFCTISDAFGVLLPFGLSLFLSFSFVSPSFCRHLLNTI